MKYMSKYLNYLKTLAKNGLKLLIASSKPEKFVKNILSQHDLLKYFALAAGAACPGFV